LTKEYCEETKKVIEKWVDFIPKCENKLVLSD
jgi:hypothetical protein